MILQKIRFHCPHCNRCATQMQIIDDIYIPSKEDLKALPPEVIVDPDFDWNAKFRCACENEMSYFDMWVSRNKFCFPDEDTKHVNLAEGKDHDSVLVCVPTLQGTKRRTCGGDSQGEWAGSIRYAEGHSSDTGTEVAV